MRYKLFCVKDGNIESGQIPPCKNCLSLHAARGNYQAAIWHRSLLVDPNPPSPLQCNGWTLGDNAEIIINWMTSAPAPDVVLEFLSCKCKKSCHLPSYQCMANGLKCAQACILQDCENMNEEEEIGDMQEDSDSDDVA